MHLFLFVKHFSRWDAAGRSCNKNKGRAIGAARANTYEMGSEQHARA